MEVLQTVTKVSSLAGCSTDTTRREIDAGRLPAVLNSNGAREVRASDAVLFGANRRFNLTLAGFGRDDAAKLADAISNYSGVDVVAGWPVIEAFSALTDDAGRTVLTVAVGKLRSRSSLLFSKALEGDIKEPNTRARLVP